MSLILQRGFCNLGFRYYIDALITLICTQGILPSLPCRIQVDQLGLLNDSFDSRCLILKTLGFVHSLSRTSFRTRLADLIFWQELFECIHPLYKVSVVFVKLFRHEISISIGIILILDQASLLTLAAREVGIIVVVALLLYNLMARLVSRLPFKQCELRWRLHEEYLPWVVRVPLDLDLSLLQTHRLSVLITHLDDNLLLLYRAWSLGCLLDLLIFITALTSFKFDIIEALVIDLLCRLYPLSQI